MAVIGRSESGFLVDHERSISESVSAFSLSSKEGLFALFEPYFRPSHSADNNSYGKLKRKRKKPLKVGPTEEDIEAAIYHKKVKETIATRVENLLRTGLSISHFCSANKHIEQDTTVPALPEDKIDFAGLLADMSTHTRQESNNPLETLIMNNGDKNLTTEKDLLGRMICHLDDKPTVLSISGQQYILPERCSFLMSDASNLEPLLTHAQQNGLYNLVVLDPPWYNKSARRGSKYSFMSLWQIKSLPVPHLLAPGALVGIWVTNKQKYLRFTKSELFPHWSVELVAEWYWVKVTRRGELVTDLDSPHKKPYEPLLIGRFTPKKDYSRTDCLNFTKASLANKNMMEFDSKLSELDSGLSPKRKRKKICEFNDDDDNETEKGCICGVDRNVTTMTSELISLDSTDLCHIECSKKKNKLLDHLLQDKASQVTSKHCLKCQKPFHENKVDLSTNLNSKCLSDTDEQIHNDQTLIEFAGQQASKWGCENNKDLNLEESEGYTNLVTNQTGKGLQSFRKRDFTLEESGVLPYHQVICSIPCKIHSRKPPLNEILCQYMSPRTRCLEMFARNLTPHWTSWGNEVLKFQSMEYFDQLPTKGEEERDLNNPA